MKSFKRLPAVLRGSILASAALLFLNIFRWMLVDVLSVFLEPLLELVVGGAFIGALIWSVVHCVRGLIRKERGVWYPLQVNLTALCIVWFAPLTEWMLDLDFTLNYNRRMAIVRRIESGELKPGTADGSGSIMLPLQDRGLSVGGGEVLVQRGPNGKTAVFFYTFRGMLDNFAGFMYKSDNATPTQDDFTGDYFIKERLHPNWFWVSAR